MPGSASERDAEQPHASRQRAGRAGHEQRPVDVAEHLLGEEQHIGSDDPVGIAEMRYHLVDLVLRVEDLRSCDGRPCAERAGRAQHVA